MARVMHARLFRREKRPLEMNAEHAGLIGRRRLHGGERIFHFFGVSLISVGRKRCRAEPAMRGGDGANALGGRRDR